ncbi:hypothetical protein SKAU_G00130570 [Synaphobranchus kaupii]|uniref:Uncharacterized protein n=1 Tax=Synaphobranchus kaupii TaxID=118154 RepID=A0A9Q1FQC0_SYNKA|nr:hypothetical protein SKAU_G00130570 [Synaphobranchus kaupii]
MAAAVPAVSDHDYDARPPAGAMDAALRRIEELEAAVRRLSLVQQPQLRRFCVSDEDFRYYTRFPSERIFYNLYTLQVVEVIRATATLTPRHTTHTVPLSHTTPPRRTAPARHTTTPSTDTAFLSDSNGKHVDMRRMFPGRRVCKLWCPTTKSALQLLSDSTLGNPGTIIIHTGTNDLASQWEGVAGSVIGVAERATQHFPRAKIVISTLLPMPTYPSIQ